MKLVFISCAHPRSKVCLIHLEGSEATRSPLRTRPCRPLSSAALHAVEKGLSLAQERAILQAALASSSPIVKLDCPRSAQGSHSLIYVHVHWTWSDFVRGCKGYKENEGIRLHSLIAVGVDGMIQAGFPITPKQLKGHYRARPDADQVGQSTHKVDRRLLTNRIACKPDQGCPQGIGWLGRWARAGGYSFGPFKAERALPRHFGLWCDSLKTKIV